MGGQNGKGGTHFWQARTALDLPPWEEGGGGGETQGHPPTHRLTNTKENIREKISDAFGAGKITLPLNITNPLLDCWPNPNPWGGGGPM